MTGPIPLADSSSPTSLLSIISGALLPFFSTVEACTLRLICREFKDAVASHPWLDCATVIQGELCLWRACFPRARAANIRRWGMPGEPRRYAPVRDADFVHLAGLKELNMGSCREVTDAAFAHLQGIQVLNMVCCPLLTDAAFVNLRGIHTLVMAFCAQPAISDAAFANLRGIHTLNMSGCNQATVSNTAFEHIRGVASLTMRRCTQESITPAFVHSLVGVKELKVWDCREEVVLAALAAGLVKGGYEMEFIA